MKTIDIKKLKQMFANGGAVLAKDYAYINDLNVFPVPDGDTGTNMKITINGALEAVSDFNETDLQLFGKKFSRGLLMNARGNSGVIFSQIIKGFTSTFKEHQTELTMADLTQAFLAAKTMAYHSVNTPIEGTILTVIRVVAEKLQAANNDFVDLQAYFDFVRSSAEAILNKTPEFLQELKDAGVVDSGGYGLCRFFEGMSNALSDNKTEKIREKEQPKITLTGVANDDNDGFGYCCEFILQIGSKVATSQSEKENFNLDNLKKKLIEIGDSLVAVRDEEIVKVHIHSLTPYKVLEIGSRYGEFNKIKIENMTLQFLQKNANSSLNIAASLTDLKLSDEIKIIATVPSENLKEIYTNQFKITNIINTENKGNPSIQEFVNQINDAKCNKIIIIVDDSNVILAAQKAMELTNQNVKIELLPAKNIMQSYMAILAFNPASSLSDNIKAMRKVLKNARVGTFSKSIKLVNYPNITVQQDDSIGIIDKKIVFSDKSLTKTIKNTIDKLLRGKGKVKKAYIICGKDATIKDMAFIKKYVSEKYVVSCNIIDGQQPVYPFYVGFEK